MIKGIVALNDEPCTEVDVTFENGLAHSVLRPADGLIWDLVHSVKASDGELLTAKQIGYNKRAMVFVHKGGTTVLMNPKILSLSGRKHYTKITISYYATDGMKYIAKFKGHQSNILHEGLEMIGVKKIKT